MRSLVLTAFVACLAGVTATKHHGGKGHHADVVDKTNIEQAFAARNEFNAFMVRYLKTYSSEEEMEKAFNIFQSNKALIEEMNAKEGATIYGINEFADIDPTEFQKMYAGFKPDPRNEHIRRHAPVLKADTSILDNVTSWDWRSYGAVTAVKNQGQCGSCWAFSATEAVESAWFLNKKGSLPILSPQQIVDCDTVDAGCDGGDTVTAYSYLKKAKGQEAEKDYPYTGVDGTCKFNSSKIVATASAYTYAVTPCYDSCKKQDETALAANIAATGPASICVNANSAWQLYTSGVITASTSCSGSYSALNHCVHLVGFNVNPTTGKQYWLVKNSWGTSWGQGGYIYLELGSNLCGLADEATFVTP